jgi:hypothetical protein
MQSTSASLARSEVIQGLVGIEPHRVLPHTRHPTVVWMSETVSTSVTQLRGYQPKPAYWETTQYTLIVLRQSYSQRRTVTLLCMEQDIHELLLVLG